MNDKTFLENVCKIACLVDSFDAAIESHLRLTEEEAELLRVTRIEAAGRLCDMREPGWGAKELKAQGAPTPLAESLGPVLEAAVHVRGLIHKTNL